MKELMAAALMGPLNPKQQQQLSANIKSDPNFLQQVNVTPNNVSFPFPLYFAEIVIFFLSYLRCNFVLVYYIFVIILLIFSFVDCP